VRALALTKTTPGYLAASSSKNGPIILHGPHHDAVKSTSSCTTRVNEMGRGGGSGGVYVESEGEGR
jgi:hypothetical protein